MEILNIQIINLIFCSTLIFPYLGINADSNFFFYSSFLATVFCNNIQLNCLKDSSEVKNISNPYEEELQEGNLSVKNGQSD